MQATCEPTPHPVVSRQDWVQARTELLAKEKAWTRLRDDLSQQRRALPWVRLDKTYTFDTGAGPKTLSDLFEGRSQLMIYHFMLGPDWKEGCASCSMVADGFDATIVHLRQRDVTLLAASRTPLSNIQSFRQRMGWHFNWVSSFQSDFNTDFGVSFSPEELATGQVQYNYQRQPWQSEEGPGLSVFVKNEQGEVFHTYSTFGRGLETMLGVYSLLDLAPHGRNEGNLPMAMGWVRHHDRYEEQKASGCSHCEAP